MIKRVKIIGQTQSAADLFLGRVREITVNTTKNALRVHDGATIGGFEQARADVSNVAAATAILDGKMTAAQAGDLSTSKASIDAHVGSTSGHPNATTSLSGFESAADKTKLDSVETAAKDDQTAVEILALLLTVDGDGSGLDADLLGGLAETIAATVNTIMRRDAAGRSKVVDPNVAADIATKGYVDTEIINNRQIPTGGITTILFHQSAAPTGWTKDVAATLDNSALRIVTSTAFVAGKQGATAFTSVFGSGKSSANYTLLVADIPSHSHTLDFKNDSLGGGTIPYASSSTGAVQASPSTSNTGGGGAHNHTLSLDLQYINLIIASKD